MNKIVVTSLNKKNTFYEKEIKKIAKKVLQFLKKENCYLEIFLINSRKMRILNKKFRNPARKQASYGAGKNKTTSILTFIEPKNFPHPESKLKPLGEIYLNATQIYADKDADRRGYISVNQRTHQRLSALLAHGLLHLIGFQHQKKSDRIKMEAKEKFLISHV